MSPEENSPSHPHNPGFDDKSKPDPNADLQSSPTPEDMEPGTDNGDAEPVEASVVAEPSVDSSKPSPVLAEVVHTDAVTAPGYPGSTVLLTTPPIARNMENLAANGGAIGSLVLGVWCVLGSFITPWTMINGGIGLAMGTWGLTSRKRRMAWFGIFLCLVGILMSLAQVNELINTYLNQVDESQF